MQLVEHNNCHHLFISVYICLYFFSPDSPLAALNDGPFIHSVILVYIIYFLLVQTDYDALLVFAFLSLNENQCYCMNVCVCVHIDISWDF